MVKLIIFDLDGVLVSTKDCIDFRLEYQHIIDNGISFFTDICLDKGVDVHWLKQNVNLVDWYKDRTVYDW